MALPSSAQQSGVPRILFLLFAAGWAANYFTALLPVLEQQGGYPSGSLEAAFGLYALGLLPSLLSGGVLADRFHARPITIIGAVVAIIGNLSIFLFDTPLGTTLARFLVGIGVGLSISAGNAWAGKARPQGGAALAGTVLTAGFATGPLLGGITSALVPPEASVLAPVTTTVALSSLSVALVATMRLGAETQAVRSATDAAAPLPRGTNRSLGPALWRAIPMALWVFSCITVPMVVLAGRIEADVVGPVSTGLIGFAALGTGAITQIIARRRQWGPRSGIVGTLFATTAFVLSGVFGDPATLTFALSCAILFGIAYGLCLRNGLMDIEKLAPLERRGLVGGIYYVATYLGFSLPYLLTMIEPAVGASIPLLVIAGLAAGTAVLRAVQLGREPSTGAEG